MTKSIRQLSTNSKGYVGIETYRNRYRIRIPASVKGSKRYLNTGYEATTENYRKVLQIVAIIEEHIDTNQLDPTLESYKPNTRFTSVVAPCSVSLLDLWQEYIAIKRLSLSKTTVENRYKTITNTLLKSGIDNPGLSNQLINYILKNHTTYSAKSILVHLDAFGRWSVRTKKLLTNPFEDSAVDLDYISNFHLVPFTVAERTSIIKAFENSEYYAYYTPIVTFGFFSGMRIGEMLAITYADFLPNMQKVRVNKSYSTASNMVKGTKTNKGRSVPINAQLRGILESFFPSNWKELKDELVFCAPKYKGYINAKNLGQRVWRTIIEDLVAKGEVSHYRSIYGMRHTFISHALANGCDIVSLAKIVGNSPNILLSCYADVIDQVTLPIL